MNEEKLAPPRTIGFWGSSLFQINGMIGSAIFALPAVLAAALGTFAPWMMLIGGVIFLPIVLVFAWLSARYEGTGGPVLYGQDAFGSFAGFQAGWGRYAAGIAALAANAHIMIAYLAATFPVLTAPTIATASAIGTIVLLAGINLLGMRGSVATLGALTVLKLAPLVVIIGAAAFGSFADRPFILPDFSDAESVILLLFYAFSGFENVTVPAGEVRDPKRDIPRVLVTVLAAVTALYALVIWAYLAINPPAETGESALAAAAEVAMGPWGALLIVVAASFSIAANNFTNLIIVPRIAFGMAQQGMLPDWLGRVNPRFLTPANSIVFYGCISAILAALGGFVLLAAASTLTRMMTYIISAAALPVLEYREGKRDAVHIGVALLAIIASLWIASHANGQAWAVFGALLAFGTLLYLMAGRRRRKARVAA